MRVLDLFAGLGGWSAPFSERGHEVITLDNDPRFGCTHTADVLEWEPEGDFDIVLASPPCEKFSVMSFWHAWLPGYVPKHDGTRLAMDLVRRSVELIEKLQPSFWIIENPMGMLRKLWLIPYERTAVTYCAYGSPYRKETDLWGGFSPSWEPRPRCRNGDTCHVGAPRGSRTGIQGELMLTGGVDRQNASAERAKIPAELALDICLAAEHDFAASRRAADYTGRLFA